MVMFPIRHPSNNFNPRLRYGERRDLVRDGLKDVSISIHAPVWGATMLTVDFLLDYAISIDAPVWGATGASGQ